MYEIIILQHENDFTQKEGSRNEYKMQTASTNFIVQYFIL